jgi:hypothetical protein
MKKDVAGEENVVFCTECGEKLNNFCFDDTASNVDSVKKHMEECKREGRYKGDMCARVFIADDHNLEDMTLLGQDEEDDV